MRTFDVYEDSAGQFRAVKQGWSWAAFLFGGLWAVATGLWARAVLLLGAWLVTYVVTAVYGAYNTGGYAAEYGLSRSIDGAVAALLLAYVSLKIYAGIRGNHWRRNRVRRAGYAKVASLEAASKRDAIAEHRKASAAPTRYAGPAVGAIGRPLAGAPAFAAAEGLDSPRRDPTPVSAPVAEAASVDPSEGRDSRVGDSLKLVLAAAIGACACVTVVGVLPVGILLVGLGLALQGGQSRPLKTATAIVAGFGLLLLAVSVTGGLLLVFYILSEGQAEAYSAFNPTEALLATLAVGGLSLASVLALRYLWLRPLLRQLSALRRALVGVRTPERPPQAAPQKIVTRSGLQTYSVADEIAKWKALHNDGVIDDHEYQRARAQLLKSD